MKARVEILRILIKSINQKESTGTSSPLNELLLIV